MSTIQLKRTLIGTVPTSLADGELLIDQKNSLLYWKDSSGVINSLNLKSSAQTSAQLISILGYTPYNGTTNPNGYLTSVSQAAVLSALGFIPADNASLGTAATKNVGTAANNILQLDANGKIPAVDGSQLTNINGGTGLIGFRNLFINGSLAVQQRGASFSANPLSGVYTADGWRIDRTGIGATSVSLNADTNYGSANRATITAAMAAGDVVDFKQRIESVNTVGLAGNAVTISFWAAIAASTGTTSVSVILSYPTATDNFTTVTTIAQTTVSVTSTPTLYSATFTGLPTNVANGLEASIRMTQTVATGSPAISFGSLQLEKGTIATPFERRPYSIELGMAQRSFWDSNPSGSTPSLTAIGSASAAGLTFLSGIIYPVRMRATPTLTFRNQSYFNGSSLSSTVNLTSTGFVPQAVSGGAGGMNALFNLQASAEL